MKSNVKRLFAGPYILWMIGFTIIPLLLIVYYGLTTKSGAFTLANVCSITTPEHMKALLLSLGLSLAATAICLLLSYPLALVLRRRGIGAGSFMVFVFILPMWMNFLLRTLAWQTLLEKNGVINVILPIYNVLAKIDDNTINAAKDLGANNFQTLIHIWIPLSIPGIISGITMVFVPALTTFVISSLLGGSKILLIGNVIEQEFTKGSNWHLGSGLSLVLMIFILLSMALIAKYDKEGEGNAF